MSPSSRPDPDQPSDPSGHSRRRRLLALGIAVLVVAAAAGAYLVLRDDDASYPKEWDARIKPYVKIVEDERGLTFEHPVKVRFLSKAEFKKTTQTDKKDLDKQERQDVEETTSLFRAFGLISGKVDLFEAFNDASGAGTLAYYSFDDRTITIRGTKLALASRATLVHELTHGLQDQRFDVADRIKKLDKAADDGKPTTESDALQALVEGDAERVADLYRASLSADERAALQKAESADQDDSTDELESVPKVVLTLMGAPYALGQALAETVAAKDADDIDDLFEDPPPDDSVLLDPLKALGDIADPAEVEVPQPASGEKKFDSGQVGSLVTYLMLAERIPLRTALAAADTWTGDAYLGFRRKDVLCARVDYAADSASGAGRLTSAFDDWIAADPGSSAKVSRKGDRVTFESCDPGTDAELANDASTRALQLVTARGYLGAQIVKAGGSAEIATCFSRRVVEEFSVDDLIDPKFGANDPDVIKRVQGLAAGCR